MATGRQFDHTESIDYGEEDIEFFIQQLERTGRFQVRRLDSDEKPDTRLKTPSLDAFRSLDLGTSAPAKEASKGLSVFDAPITTPARDATEWVSFLDAYDTPTPVREANRQFAATNPFSSSNPFSSTFENYQGSGPHAVHFSTPSCTTSAPSSVSVSASNIGSTQSATFTVSSMPTPVYSTVSLLNRDLGNQPHSSTYTAPNMTPFSHYALGGSPFPAMMQRAPLFQVPTSQNVSSFPDRSVRIDPLSAKVPKLSQFSGEDRKGDVDFEIWKFDVSCLIKEGVYGQHAIMEAIRRSLTGKARRALVNLGEFACVSDVVSELEAIYGNVSSTEKAKEQFYSAYQNAGESLGDYSIRLEQLFSRAQLTVNKSTRDKMLCNRLWSGLRDNNLRNMSRYKFESVQDFNQLRKELRQFEQDLVARSSSVLVSSPISSPALHSNVSPAFCESSSTGLTQTTSSASVSSPASQNLTTADSQLLKEMKALSEQMQKMQSKLSYMDKDLQSLKREQNSSNKWKTGGNRNNQSNQNNQRQSGGQKSEKPSENSGRLNGNAPPSKGQK